MDITIVLGVVIGLFLAIADRNSEEHERLHKQAQEQKKEIVIKPESK